MIAKQLLALYLRPNNLLQNTSTSSIPIWETAGPKRLKMHEVVSSGKQYLSQHTRNTETIFCETYETVPLWNRGKKLGLISKTKFVYFSFSMQAMNAQHCHIHIVKICHCGFLILFLNVYTLGLNFPLDSTMFISIKIICYFHYKVSCFLLEMCSWIPFRTSYQQKSWQLPAVICALPINAFLV